MPSNNLISLTCVSNLRLEQFRTQHELAKNFYDDYEFCPLFHVEEVTEHRERIQRRTSPYPSPNSSVSSSSSTSSSYYMPPKQHHYYHQSLSKSNSTATTRAIPIIDPSNMTPVAIPAHQQHTQKTCNNTSSSPTQWASYNNPTSPTSTSPSSIHSSLSNNSSSSVSSNCSSNNDMTEYHANYYYNNTNCGAYQPRMMSPPVIRAIPIIDPNTRQVFRQQQQQQQQHPHLQYHHPHHYQQQQQQQQQQTIPPPGFYNVSVC